MNLKKLKNIIVSDYFILLTLTVFALFIRLLNIDKPTGLWNDEMLTYIVASKKFPLGIIKSVMEMDFHMPLYYFYVHVWMKLFGSSDVVLRLSSVIWGVLSVPAIFLLGKTYKSKALGYFLAFATALSPVMIYFSQEFRFYSLLTFLSILSLTFFLRLIETPTKKDYLLFFLSNLVILYIYTFGMVFVFAEIILLLAHFYLYKKNELKILVRYTAVFLTAAIPYLILLAQFLYASDRALMEILNWQRAGLYTLFSIMNDWFTPIDFGTNLFSGSNFKSFINSPYLIMASSVSAFFVIGFALSLRELNKKLLYLFTIALTVLSVELALYLKGNFTIVVRYTMIIWPIVILLCSSGILSIRTKNLKTAIIAFILTVYIGNILNYKNVYSFSTRAMGIKPAADYIINHKFDKNDYLLYPFVAESFAKYIKDSHFIDFSTCKIISLDKTKKEQTKVFDSKFIKTATKHNAIDKLPPYLLSIEPSIEMKNFMDASIAQIPKGNKLILISDSTFFERTKPDEINSYTKSYKAGEMARSEYKLRLCGLLNNKMFYGLKNLIESNPSIKFLGIRIVNHPQNIRWKLYYYEKI